MKQQTKLFLLGLAVWLAGCGRPAEPGAVLQGDVIGNGGHVVICRDSENRITSARLLDFYEASVLRDSHYTLGSASLSAIEKVRLALGRLEKIDPVRAKRYLDRANVFLDNLSFAEKVPLSPTNDYGYVQLPSYCKIEQLCIQKPPTAKNTLYTVNLDYWDRLDTDHKAGLVLHEIVYTDDLDRKLTDSVRTRRLASEIAGHLFGAKSVDEYKAQLKLLGLDFTGEPAPTPSLFWTAPPRFAAFVGSPLNAPLAGYVRNESGEPLVFKTSAGNGPSWMFLALGGMLGGSPTAADVGVHRIFVTAYDGKGRQAHTEVTVMVFGSNPADLDVRWFKQIVTVFLPDARAGRLYKVDLLNDDRVPKEAVGGWVRPFELPAFLKGSGWTFEGTPSRAHVGKHAIYWYFADRELLVKYEITVTR